jgi:hypothetical protein
MDAVADDEGESAPSSLDDAQIAGIERVAEHALGQGDFAWGEGTRAGDRPIWHAL